MRLYGSGRYCGRKLGGYTLGRMIGKGRYGVCFLATSDAGKEVVIKKFRPSILKRNEKNNSDEAVILSALQNKRIPEFLGVVNQKGFYGFILERKQGHTLKDMLFKQGHKFTNSEIYDIGSQLIEIIKFLHENGVVHRDIRIPNVLVHEGDVCLVDFGLARWADGERYPYNLDFSYLGDLLVYLLYSSYEKDGSFKSRPWYEELSLDAGQKLFLKRLFGLEAVYKSIYDIEMVFNREFKLGHCPK